jgi:hypothetical protein
MHEKQNKTPERRIDPTAFEDIVVEVTSRGRIVGPAPMVVGIVGIATVPVLAWLTAPWYAYLLVVAVVVITWIGHGHGTQARTAGSLATVADPDEANSRAP